MTRRIALAGLLVTGVATPILAGGLAIVGTKLRDNGDHDGYADTLETAEVWLTVKNTTAVPLTGVTVNLILSTTSDPPLGQTYFVLVRAETPHRGSWGRASNGVERSGLCGFPP